MSVTLFIIGVLCIVAVGISAMLNDGKPAKRYPCGHRHRGIPPASCDSKGGNPYPSDGQELL